MKVHLGSRNYKKIEFPRIALCTGLKLHIWYMQLCKSLLNKILLGKNWNLLIVVSVDLHSSRKFIPSTASILKSCTTRNRTVLLLPIFISALTTLLRVATVIDRNQLNLLYLHNTIFKSSKISINTVLRNEACFCAGMHKTVYLWRVGFG